MAVICVALHTVKHAGMPRKQTALAAVKPLPLRVTVPPTGPEVGVNAFSLGAALRAG